MTTASMPSSEWTAAGLRPVARWVPTLDGRGRTRLVMRWAVPEVAVGTIGMAGVTGVTDTRAADPAAA